MRLHGRKVGFMLTLAYRIESIKSEMNRVTARCGGLSRDRPTLARRESLNRLVCIFPSAVRSPAPEEKMMGRRDDNVPNRVRGR